MDEDVKKALDKAADEIVALRVAVRVLTGCLSVALPPDALSKILLNSISDLESDGKIPDLAIKTLKDMAEAADTKYRIEE